MASKLVWKGSEINKIVTRAAQIGIDVTLAAAVNHAKSNHDGWKNVTGTAEGSIRMTPAVVHGRKVVGEFGSYDVDYFIHLELGTCHRTGDYTLNRAADTEFPKLAHNIRSAM